MPFTPPRHPTSSADDDIGAAVPPAPPPRPAAREAAIAAALHRFDARVAPSQAASRRPAIGSEPRKTWIGRPQMAALATVAIAAVIAVPVWMAGDPRFTAPSRSVPRPAPVVRSAPALVAGEPTSPLAARGVAPVMQDAPAAMREVRPADAASLAAPAVAAKEDGGQQVAEEVAPPPPPPPPAPPPPPPPPMAMVAAPRAPEAAGADIVVTGSKVVSAPAAAPATLGRRVAEKMRDDWRSCTIQDPRRDPERCKPSTALGTDTPALRAEAMVADGVALAWKGDASGAIAAFDRAIAISPRLGTAYLNRGLARQGQGDTQNALADADRAVRYAPRAASSYYGRSLIRRQQGDAVRADADEARALRLQKRDSRRP